MLPTENSSGFSAPLIWSDVTIFFQMVRPASSTLFLAMGPSHRRVSPECRKNPVQWPEHCGVGSSCPQSHDAPACALAVINNELNIAISSSGQCETGPWVGSDRGIRPAKSAIVTRVKNSPIMASPAQRELPRKSWVYTTAQRRGCPSVPTYFPL